MNVEKCTAGSKWRRTRADDAPATTFHNFPKGGSLHEASTNGAPGDDGDRGSGTRAEREEGLLPAAEHDDDPLREPRRAILRGGDEGEGAERRSRRPERAGRPAAAAAA